MTDAELRSHVKAPKAEHGHEQPADAVDTAPIEELRMWHDEWEHRPRNGYPTHLGHAHDEFTARREGAPIVGRS